jgi:hypothetical protein
VPSSQGTLNLRVAGKVSPNSRIVSAGSDRTCLKHPGGRSPLSSNRTCYAYPSLGVMVWSELELRRA